ncbi:MAG: hypothetical protein V4726_20625 [Verrucomicrobiota bacterium]
MELLPPLNIPAPGWSASGMRSLLTVTVLSLALLSGCGRPGIAGAPSWSTKLSALPEDVRHCLLDHFDYSKSFRRKHPEYPSAKAEEIITDNPRQFNAGCVVPSGFAGTLFVRAKEVGPYWIIEYEYGGVARGSDVLILSRNGIGGLRKADRSVLAPNERNADTIARILAGKKTGRE